MYLSPTLFYELSVTATSVPACNAEIIHDTLKPNPTSGNIISHIHRPPHSHTWSQKEREVDVSSLVGQHSCKEGGWYEGPVDDGTQSRETHLPVIVCKQSLVD